MSLWPWPKSTTATPAHSPSAWKQLFTTFDRELISYEKNLKLFDDELDKDFNAVLHNIPPSSLIHPKATSALRGRITTAKQELERIFEIFHKRWKHISAVREKKITDDSHFIHQFTDTEYKNVKVQAERVIDEAGKMFTALNNLDTKLAANENPHQAVSIFWVSFNPARAETIRVAKVLYGTLERGA
jgi:hypothetical protein